MKTTIFLMMLFSVNALAGTVDVGSSSVRTQKVMATQDQNKNWSVRCRLKKTLALDENGVVGAVGFPKMITLEKHDQHFRVRGKVYGDIMDVFAISCLYDSCSDNGQLLTLRIRFPLIAHGAVFSSGNSYRNLVFDKQTKSLRYTSTHRFYLNRLETDVDQIFQCE